MFNLGLTIFLFIFFFFSTLKLSVSTLGLLLLLSFVTNKLYNTKPMYFLFYIFFCFFYVLILFKYYNFTLMFLIFAVLYATIFIVFFIFFVSFEDLKKTREVFKNSIFFFISFFFFSYLFVNSYLDYYEGVVSTVQLVSYENFYESALSHNTNEFYHLYNMVYLSNNSVIFFFFLTLVVICFSISLLLNTSFKVKSYKWTSLLSYDNLKKKINIFIKRLKSRNSVYVFFSERSGLYTTY
jgi:hypothetical protein